VRILLNFWFCHAGSLLLSAVVNYFTTRIQFEELLTCLIFSYPEIAAHQLCYRMRNGSLMLPGKTDPQHSMSRVTLYNWNVTELPIGTF
jgi:hypothetical protein